MREIRRAIDASDLSEGHYFPVLDNPEVRESASNDYSWRYNQRILTFNLHVFNARSERGCYTFNSRVSRKHLIHRDM